MQNGESEKLAARSLLQRSIPLLLVVVVIAVIVTVLTCPRDPQEPHSDGTQSAVTPAPPTDSEPSIRLTGMRAPTTYEEYLLEGVGENLNDARLKLSESQSERLKDLSRDNENIAQLLSESARIQGELYALLRTESTPEQEVLDKVNRLNEALSDLRIARMRNILELRKILSIDQRRTALAIIQELRALTSQQRSGTQPQASPSAPPVDEPDLTEEIDEPQVDETSSE